MALPHRTQRLWGYWRAEQRTLRQGFVALLVSSGGDLLAGLALGGMAARLTKLPGLLLLVPAAIGLRGDVLGALGSRLGTAIHTGTFESSLRSRESVARQNLVAASALSLVTALFVGLVARAASVIMNLPSISGVDLVSISVLGGVAGSVLVGAATVGLSIAGHRRRWDLDAVAAPLVTAIGDVITLPTLWAASFVFGVAILVPSVALAAVAASVLVVIWIGVRGHPVAKRIFLESLPVLLLAGILHIGAGAALEKHLARFAAFPGLLVLVPPFLEDTGALGGILSARLASKLHLGVLSPRLRPEPPALVDVSINLVLAASVFFFLGCSGWVTAEVLGLRTPGFGTMLGVALVAGFVATGFSSLVAYLAAIATYRFGLDPDNHGIPIVTSTMDFLGAATLVTTIALFGIGGPG
jgi:mgtE-like transporter